MTFALVTLLLASPVDEEVEEEPPAPRWPGAVAMAVGGAALTAAGLQGAITTPIFGGRVSSSGGNEQLRATSLLIGAGIGSVLLGMMWLAWTHTEGSRPARAIGGLAVAAGLVESLGALARYFFVGSIGTLRNDELFSVGIIAGSGVAALAAGIAWLVWVAQAR